MNQIYEVFNLVFSGILGAISLVLFNKKTIPVVHFLAASFIGGACAYYGTPLVFFILELEQYQNNRLAGAVGFFLGICSQGIILNLNNLMESDYIKRFFRRR